MTVFFRNAALAAAALMAGATIAAAQRSRGTIGAPPATATQPPPAHPTASGRGTMSTPRGPYRAPTRRGDLPRITDGSRRGDTRYDNRYGNGSNRGLTGYNSGGIVTNRGYSIDRRPRATSRPYTRYGFGGCVYSCVSLSGGIRTGRYFSSFTIGYPFAVPIIVPYFVVATPEVYVEPRAEERYVEDTPRAASKLIVIGGGSGGGGDALTVESVGDSVRLNWLPNGRKAREVKLFVSDSAQRQLATRIASPAMPSATFEIATLSAPVAFAGVSVTFADGVMSTTVVPYRGGSSSGLRR
jgi:hypothetical protein